MVIADWLISEIFFKQYIKKKKYINYVVFLYDGCGLAI